MSYVTTAKQPTVNWLAGHIKYSLLQAYTGHAGAQLVEALRYKPEACGFDAR